MNDCYGFLIGESNENGVTVTDIIPLSHDKILAPQLDVALKFIEAANKEIVGFYENILMNKDKDNIGASSIASYICDLIHNKKTRFPVLFEVCLFKHRFHV
jgi:hypothetical protein